MEISSINRSTSHELLVEIRNRRWYNVYRAIKNGFDVDADIEPRKSILCYAVESGIIYRVRTILQFKPNVKNESNLNSLVYAFGNKGHEELFDALLLYGFDLNCSYLNSHEAFCLALEMGNYEFCEHFSKTASAMQDIAIKCPFVLHNALEKGFSEIALLLLNLGWNINATDQSGKTPLHYAFQYHELTASMLLKEETDGENDLFSAITPVHKEVVKFLIERPDINLEIADGEGCTSVNYVINDRSIFSGYSEEKRIQFLKYFITKGININAQHRIGVPLIHEAAENGCGKIVEFLMEHNANANVLNKYGQTALHLSLDLRQFKVVDILLNYEIDLSSINKCGGSLLISACHVRHKNAVDKILKLNGDANQVQNFNRSALNVAISNAHENDESAEVVRLLLDYKANVNGRDENGRTPMHNVFLNHYFNVSKKFKKSAGSENLFSAMPVTQAKIIKMLLAHPDIDLTIADNYGRTIMNYVVKNRLSIFSINRVEKKIEFIKLFLKAGMNINVQNNISTPFMHEAVMSGSEKLVKFLLDHGADVNAVDKFGQTAVHVALDLHLVNMVNMFLNYKVDVSSQNRIGESLLFSACRVHHVQAVLKLLESKANVNQIINGSTVLHIVCSDFYQADGVGNNLFSLLVKCLLDYKADVNCVDKYGNSPLHYACKCSNVEVIKLLLTHRANVNLENKAGATPLHYAIVKKQLNIIQLLLEYGANVNRCCRKHSSPLFLAIRLVDDSYSDRLRDPFYNDDSEESASSSQIIDSLLAYGTDINIQDRFGNTALHVAIRLGKASLISHLLNYNPNFNITNKNGFTPLSLVILKLELCYQNRYVYYFEDDSMEYTIELSAIFSELLTYIISMQVAGVYVSEKNVHIMKLNDIQKFDPDTKLEQWNALYDKCKKEIIGLKKRVPGTIISYYDILIKDVKEIAMYVNDEFPKLAYFENYCNIIKAKMNQAYARRSLLNKTITVFNFLFRNSPCLPELCVEKIYSNLSVWDLRCVLIASNDISAIVDFETNGGIKNIFYDVLNNKIQRFELCNLPNNCFKIFNPIFINRPKLPSNCMKKICSYLGGNDIRNLLNLCHAPVCSAVQEKAGIFYFENSKKLRLM